LKRQKHFFFPHSWITKPFFQLLSPVFGGIPLIFHGVFHIGFGLGKKAGITWGKHSWGTGISGAEVFLANPQPAQGKTAGDSRG
jgi:hypothetical protein